MSLPNAESATRLVAAAEQAIASIKYCWLATPSGAGLVNARPMGRLAPAPGDDAWLIRFITNDRSRKIWETPPGGELTVIFQRDQDDAYLSLRGEADVRSHASADRRLWREAYNAYFQGEGEREHAAFLEIRVRRMELWIRDVTPEPFGLSSSVLERDASGPWRQTG